jgi:hypothetical protein
MKALKATNALYVFGGEFTIDAEDDAFHSNGGMEIAQGVFRVKTGDDGFHADGALLVSGGTISVPACYEGLEGVSVTITGGDITVTATDDAVNAAGGSDTASALGGPRGADTFSSDGERFVRISGGTLDLYAAHDGIDSNGDVFLDGGIIKISGPSQGAEGAIDLDGTMTVTGGALITAGSILSPAADSTQPTLLVSYASQQRAGAVLEIRGADGGTLLEYTAKTAFTLSGFTSPGFTLGTTVALYIDGEKRADITLTAIVTSVGDDGGAYSGMGGFGGPGGNNFGGGNRGGNGGGDWDGGWDGTVPGGNGAGVRPDGGGVPPFGGMDEETLRAAMEIIGSSAGGELTDEQMAALRALGLTDEQIAQFSGFGGNRAARPDVQFASPPTDAPVTQIGAA